MLRVKSLATAVLAFLKRRWKWLVFLVIVVAGLGFWQWQRIQKAQPQYTFVQPTVKNLVKSIQVSGVVDAKEKASLRFAAGGKVVYLGAQEGEFVKKGQTIATIDRRTLEKQLQQDLNAYVRERWDWEVRQDATDYPVEPLATRRSLDQDQTTLNDTVLDVEIRDIAIQNTVLAAPFAGLLVASPVTVKGVQLSATDAFELINPSTLIFKAAVDEADIGSIKIGQTAEITLDAFPNEPIKTYVQSVAYKSSQSASGTVFIVELPVNAAIITQDLRLGMNGDVVVSVDSRDNVLSIPLDTTRQRDGKTFVDVKTGDKTVGEREIRVGLETDDDIEVLGGLSPQDQVVVPDSTK